MTNYREILRLQALGQSQRSIAFSTKASRNSVKDALKRAQELHITWPLDDDVTNEMLDRTLNYTVKLLWTFKVPWHWAYHGTLFSDGVTQFAFGFYSVMLTSTILGFLTMILFKPRSWYVYCPMGTMTQLICKVKHKEEKT